MNERPCAILYTSHTGFTARYAALLARMARIPAYDLGDRRERLPRGTPVLYMGWLCAGKIQGLDRARRQYRVLGVCAVGMAPPDSGQTQTLQRKNNWADLPFFYLRGGYDHQKVRGVYRLMMSAMGKVMAKKAGQDPEARQLLEIMENGADWVTPQALEPVAAWLKG
ncbi:hypothetical protein H7U37_10395 [Pseudoflavonifractor phocaeensis]|uniref:hypothetical protein n=1 Tax=Pseudoflavonifractor phocaeensis TaxID=1870988 RepID=UPI00195A9A9D|nr:hypothetical protein [Pseudoflavonifractor phocaeensis]MBM6938929.1 hypothetical protein [Pseudoflavonifractor phocaeensis]